MPDDEIVIDKGHDDDLYALGPDGKPLISAEELRRRREAEAEAFERATAKEPERR